MNTRGETEILIEMINRAEQENLISTNEDIINKVLQGQNTENQYILDLATHAYILAQLEQEINETQSDINIATANGESLDHLGMLLGVTRYTAQAPQVEITITNPITTGEDIIIPAGTNLLFVNEAYGQYITDETVTIHANTTTVTVKAKNTMLGYNKKVDPSMVNGLEGYSTLHVTNTYMGTSGRNIEEDDDYRLRIQNSAQTKNVGTKQCIEDYLYSYEGLDDFKLIPLTNGVGSLTIVCDTIPTLLPDIQEDVHNNAMLITDPAPVCTLPGQTSISVSLNAVVGTTGTLTLEEIRQHVITQTNTYIEGGYTRNGTINRGLKVGENFIPSQLIRYLLSQIPEITHITSNNNNIITIPDTNKCTIQNVEVNFI